MNKLERTIQSYQMPPYSMQIGWIKLLDKVLTTKTKEYIEHSNLELSVIARLIIRTIKEAENEEKIDGIMWDKLHDQDFIISLINNPENCY